VHPWRTRCQGCSKRRSRKTVRSNRASGCCCVAADYCSTLYADEDGAEIERCWLAYNWLDEQLAQTDAACEIEFRDGVVNGIDCQRMDKFQVCGMLDACACLCFLVPHADTYAICDMRQDFVREIVAQGNVRNMVRTLAVLAAAEKRKHEKAASAGAEASSSEGELPLAALL